MTDETGPAETLVGLARNPDTADAEDAYGSADRLIPLVLDALGNAGLAGFGERALEGWIGPGSTVLLKPNWVHHENQSGQSNECLVTHPELILAVVDLVARCRPARILIGDSPIQSCRLERLLDPGFGSRAAERAGGIPLEIRDFRRTTWNAGSGRSETGRAAADYVLFDLERESLLEPITDHRGRFRVTNYDPRRLAESHAPGTHRYLLARESLEADVFINLPKLKTHRKVGLTNALKNLVGINGNKDYLPHHRVGGSGTGGDCYPGVDPVRRAVELCLDLANRNWGSVEPSAWQRLSRRLLGLQRRLGRPEEIEGGWHGNDTCWRMCLDLNRLLLYGRPDGSFAEKPLRTIVSIVDAVVAGQAEGPLAPRPLELGCVLAGDDPACVDWVAARLLGLDPARLAITREAFAGGRFRLTARRPEAIRVRSAAGDETPEAAGRRIGARAEPASGWVGHCEVTS